MDAETKSVFDTAGEPIVGKTYLADGWVYRDMPRAIKGIDLWNHFLNIMGEENYILLAWSEYDDCRRGQLLISPDGMKRLQEHLAAKP